MIIIIIRKNLTTKSLQKTKTIHCVCVCVCPRRELGKKERKKITHDNH